MNLTLLVDWSTKFLGFLGCILEDLSLCSVEMSPKERKKKALWPSVPEHIGSSLALLSCFTPWSMYHGPSHRNIANQLSADQLSAEEIRQLRQLPVSSHKSVQWVVSLMPHLLPWQHRRHFASKKLESCGFACGNIWRNWGQARINEIDPDDPKLMGLTGNLPFCVWGFHRTRFRINTTTKQLCGLWGACLTINILVSLILFATFSFQDRLAHGRQESHNVKTNKGFSCSTWSKLTGRPYHSIAHQTTRTSLQITQTHSSTTTARTHWHKSQAFHLGEADAIYRHGEVLQPCEGMGLHRLLRSWCGLVEPNCANSDMTSWHMVDSRHVQTKDDQSLSKWYCIKQNASQVFVHVKYCIGGQPAVGDEVTFDIELFGCNKKCLLLLGRCTLRKNPKCPEQPQASLSSRVKP